MKPRKIKPLLVILLLILLPWNPAFAKELPEGMNDFVHTFLAAAKQQNRGALEELTHHAVRECTTGTKQQQFYDQLITQTIKTFSREDPVMKTTYQPFSPQDLKNLATRLKKKKITWPVNPDGRVVIMYAVFHKIAKLPIYVKYEVDSWKWVPFCREEYREETDPVADVEFNDHNSFALNFNG